MTPREVAERLTDLERNVIDHMMRGDFQAWRTFQRLYDLGVAADVCRSDGVYAFTGLTDFGREVASLLAKDDQK